MASNLVQTTNSFSTRTSRRMGASFPQTPEDRLRMIGDLLCKGILGSPTLGSAPSEAVPGLGAVSVSPEERILDYLRRHEWASPAEMRVVLKLSRTRTTRALQRLILAHQIASNGGKTTAAAYRLNAFDASRN